MGYNTNFDEIYFEDGKRRIKKVRGAACFAQISRNDKMPNVLRYICKPTDSLSNEEIDFYLSFLKQVLTKYPFTTKKTFIKKYVIFEMDVSKFSYKMLLLHFTAFRYLDEFPEIVAALFKASKQIKDISELFEKFECLHNDNLQGKLLTPRGYLGSHGLAYPYGTATFIPISLMQFWGNLDKNLSQVHDYFKHTAPAGKLIN